MCESVTLRKQLNLLKFLLEQYTFNDQSLRKKKTIYICTYVCVHINVCVKICVGL